MDRRVFLATTVSSVAGLMLRGHGDGPDDDEPTDAVKAVLKSRFGDRTMTKAHVQFDIPENAPDGRFVPILLEIDLPDTPKAFHLIVDHNPDIYVAGFWGVASIDTRIKMRRTSYVRAIAEMNNGELYVANKKVFVMTNGCG